MVTSHFYVGIKCDIGWLNQKSRLSPTSDGKNIYTLSKQIFDDTWNGEGIHQVQVTALDPTALQHQQFDLFTDTVEPNASLNSAIDKINQRYGEFTVAPASIMDRSNMPNVISPAWRPSGHRKTI
ncbi:MAG: hypothetical protein HOL04_00775 [Gammaproteobacteria bacterium]|nr:hypothetical protein [Gammaproteobacteria bacterium]MBT4331591.1 hypothetical protein [Gammaproteobacteria bacterium]MBT5360253.1 hypothetical protein [Gammaproteobacteria bacterium]MBT5636513.1 hypothetical protein [Gammaproteobacteria bacterium]MBT8007364.1 hypothetical protein [Gammaproteobacteria bacterium]